MHSIPGTRLSLLRVSELITGDIKPSFVFLFPLNDAFVLVKGWVYAPQEHTAQPLPLPPFQVHTYIHFFCPDPLQRGPVCLIIDLMHNHCLLYVRQNVGTKPDEVQKSLQIILNHLHWPTVQNIHLHWVSAASKHWTPFNNYYCQHLQAVPTAEYPTTHISSSAQTLRDVCTTVAETQTSFKQTLSGSERQPSFSFDKPQPTFNVNKCRLSFP